MTAATADIPVIETPRLRLRVPRESDLPAMIAFGLSDRMIYIGGAISEDETREIYESALTGWAARGYGRWSVELRETGEFIGRCGINHPFDYPDPELGWLLFEGYEGHGYAREAAAASLADGRSRLGLKGIVSLIHPENIRSKHLSTRIGGQFDTMGEIIGHTMEVWRYADSGATGEGRVA